MTKINNLFKMGERNEIESIGRFFFFFLKNTPPLGN